LSGERKLQFVALDDGDVGWFVEGLVSRIAELMVEDMMK
jgi:hypothetical protein